MRSRSIASSSDGCDRSVRLTRLTATVTISVADARCATHEVHDLHFVSLAERRRGVVAALDDGEVTLDGDPPRIEIQ